MHPLVGDTQDRGGGAHGDPATGEYRDGLPGLLNGEPVSVAGLFADGWAWTTVLPWSWRLRSLTLQNDLRDEAGSVFVGSLLGNVLLETGDGEGEPPVLGGMDDALADQRVPGGRDRR